MEQFGSSFKHTWNTDTNVLRLGTLRAICVILIPQGGVLEPLLFVIWSMIDTKKLQADINNVHN